MRFAVNIPPFAPADEIVDLAVEAEAAGWDGVFLWDHLQLQRSMQLDVHNPWVLLGAIAQATSRVMLGPLVTPLARRRPWQVVKELVTLDHLSGGRAILGVGLGFPDDDDFEAFGEAVAHAERAAQLDEALDVVDVALRDGTVHHRGTHYSVDADLRPLPVQRPRPPIWVAGMAPNRRPLRRAQRFDGVVPIRSDGEPMSAAEVADYIAPLERPAGYDVVVTRDAEVPVEQYEEVGVTWLVESAWPVGDWMTGLRTRVRSLRH